MHWLDTEILVFEIDGEFYALNGWDGEKYTRCWACTCREGDKFCKVLGVDTYTITPTQDSHGIKFLVDKNPLIGTKTNVKSEMYKNLVPYSGLANTITGEMLRAVDFIYHSQEEPRNISGAIKYIRNHTDDEFLIKVLDEISNKNFERFAVLKHGIEWQALKDYESNKLEENNIDFEDLDD